MLYMQVFGLLAALSLALFTPQLHAAEPLVDEGFENYEIGQPLPMDTGGWALTGSIPQTRIVAKRGRDSSQALALYSAEPFNSMSAGLVHEIASTASGTLWMQATIQEPKAWAGIERNGGLIIDLCHGSTPLARVAGWADAEGKVDWHAGWGFNPEGISTVKNWRPLHKLPPQPSQLVTVTMKLDLDQRVYSAWVGRHVLAEGTLMGNDPEFCPTNMPIDRIYLSGGGASDSDALLIDNVYVGTTRPQDFELDRDLVPARPKDAQFKFRFAVYGDPQPGHQQYDEDLASLLLGMKQVNQADVDFTIFLGDMVDDGRDERSYRHVSAALSHLKKPWYSVRGNHDQWADRTNPLYDKYILPGYLGRVDRSRNLNNYTYSFDFGGFRFIMLDNNNVAAPLREGELEFVKQQAEAAKSEGQEIVISSHVPLWQGHDKTNLGGDDRGVMGQVDRHALVKILDDHDAVLHLAGHLHRGTWQATMGEGDHFPNGRPKQDWTGEEGERETRVIVTGGSSDTREGSLSWCIVDVYDDHLEVITKPLFFAWERPDAVQFFNYNPPEWRSYADEKLKHPYYENTPFSIQRRRPEK